MSSMRNAIHRRNHKERSQPHERAKWGLLEKHKDYSLRAKDHNAKKRKIKALQQKASERNEDEFYFGMMSSKTQRGIKVAERGEDNSGGQLGAGKSLNTDVVKLMKTQDCAYLRTVLQSSKNAAKRLEEDVAMLEHGVLTTDKAPGKRIFADDDSHQLSQLRQTNHDMELDDLLYLDDIADSGSEVEDQVTKALTPAERKKKRALEVKRRQLDALRRRERDLTTALREVEDQRHRMNGTTGGVNKRGTKFKSRQRHR